MIHITGLPFLAGTELRQLRVWCGHRLIGVDLANVSMSTDGGAASYPKVDSLVLVDGNLSRVMVDAQERGDG